MASAVSSGAKFKELFLGKQVQARQAKSEKQRLVEVSHPSDGCMLGVNPDVEALNEDPYDIEVSFQVVLRYTADSAGAKEDRRGNQDGGGDGEYDSRDGA